MGDIYFDKVVDKNKVLSRIASELIREGINNDTLKTNLKNMLRAVYVLPISRYVFAEESRREGL